MTTISLRLPDSLHKNIRSLAKGDHISMNQFINSALSEKISAIMTVQYIEKRGEKGSAEKYRKALSKVPDIEPESFDKIG